MRPQYFFDRLEDRIRGWLTKHPFVYALYGGMGIVLFWRGVWLAMDVLAEHFLGVPRDGVTTVNLVVSIWDAAVSFGAGGLILLSCGLFVSELIGKEIIISGLRGEKKLAARTETEVRTETGALAEVLERLERVEASLEDLAKKL